MPERECLSSLAQASCALMPRQYGGRGIIDRWRHGDRSGGWRGGACLLVRTILGATSFKQNDTA